MRKRAHHDAEVAGHRLLAGQDVHGELVEGAGCAVDLVVFGDDALGERDVRLVERPRRVLDGDLDERGDLDETVLYLPEFLLEDFAHRCMPLSLRG